MPLKPEGTGKVREQLELISLELIEAGVWLPDIEERIEQAIHRSGLSSLLMPASEMVSLVKDLVEQARLDVIEAERRLDDIRLRSRPD